MVPIGIIRGVYRDSRRWRPAMTDPAVSLFQGIELSVLKTQNLWYICRIGRVRSFPNRHLSRVVKLVEERDWDGVSVCLTIMGRFMGNYRLHMFWNVVV